MEPRGSDTARAIISEQVRIDVLSKSQEEENLISAQQVARNFVSDTVTVPTQAMYTYAAQASIGDDVYHDSCTNALENHVARLTGKEAGLFLPSGTMSNQIALRVHLKQPPYSVLFDQRSHICVDEAGGTAFHSGAQGIPVLPSNGHHLNLNDVKKNIIPSGDIHWAATELIALENTLGGTIFPQADIIAISDFAKGAGIKLHLDGARLWHVAAETATPLKDLCDPFDSVSLCFSKGLGAPIGTCLVGSTTFICRARMMRKLFGGGMRQTGFLAACAAYALTHNFPRLTAVHALTRRLERGLEDIGVHVTSRGETCMVFYDPSVLGLDFADIRTRASQLAEPIALEDSRLVVHIQTSEKAVDDFLALLKEMAREKRGSK